MTKTYKSSGLNIGNQISLKQMANHFNLLLHVDDDNSIFNFSGNKKSLDGLTNTRGWKQLNKNVHIQLENVKSN